MSKWPKIQYLVFQYYDYIKYKFIGRSLVSGTQTLCGRIEPPKQDANLTFYVPGLKPRPNDVEMA